VKGFSLNKKAKKSWVTVRVNNRKMKVTALRNSGSLRISIKLVYGKWARGNYNLSVSYKDKSGSSWRRGSFGKNGIFTVY
jgi:hypothetical protein